MCVPWRRWHLTAPYRLGSSPARVLRDPLDPDTMPAICTTTSGGSGPRTAGRAPSLSTSGQRQPARASATRSSTVGRGGRRGGAPPEWPRLGCDRVWLTRVQVEQRRHVAHHRLRQGGLRTRAGAVAKCRKALPRVHVVALGGYLAHGAHESLRRGRRLADSEALGAQSVG